MITVQDTWERAFDGPARADVEALLPAFLTSSRWFGGKAKTIHSSRFANILRLDMAAATMMLGFVEVSYAEGGAETYTVPMTAAFEEEADRIRRDHANAVIGSLTVARPQGSQTGLLYDALWNDNCAYSLLRSMGRRAQFQGPSGKVVASSTPLFDEISAGQDTDPVSIMKAEQSNTSVRFGDRVIMKLYRRVEPGMNPELEIGRALTARRFEHSPSVVGALEYTHENDEPMTLALAQTFMPNQGNAWEYTLSQLTRYLDSVSSRDPKDIPSKPSTIRGFESSLGTADLFFGFMDMARLLGHRTAELHLTLGEASRDPAFAPETCPSSYVQSRVEAMSVSATRALTLLRNRLSALSESDREQGRQVLGHEPAILDRLGSLSRAPLTAMRIRCHGDYHLGQVLYTGHDFVIIDYEGEPARSLAERRAKHIPIVDLAGMIRSFHYAAHAALRQRLDHRTTGPAMPSLAPWAEHWYQSARATFLRGYRVSAGQAPFSPQSQQEFNLLLEVHVLEKSLYELSYELNNRPDWVALPLAGILQCAESSVAPDDQGDWVDQEANVDDSCATGRPRNEVNQ